MPGRRPRRRIGDVESSLEMGHQARPPDRPLEGSDVGNSRHEPELGLATGRVVEAPGVLRRHDLVGFAMDDEKRCTAE
jgi:hypothetical protein